MAFPHLNNIALCVMDLILAAIIANAIFAWSHNYCENVSAKKQQPKHIHRALTSSYLFVCNFFSSFLSKLFISVSDFFPSIFAARMLNVVECNASKWRSKCLCKLFKCRYDLINRYAMHFLFLFSNWNCSFFYCFVFCGK